MINASTIWVINQKNDNIGTNILKSNLMYATPNHVRNTIPAVLETKLIAEKPTPYILPWVLVINTPTARCMTFSRMGAKTPNKR